MAKIRSTAFMGVLAAAPLLIAFTNCSGFSTASLLPAGGDTSLHSFTTESADGVQLIADNSFSLGANLQHACANPDTDQSCALISSYAVKNPYSGSASPVWGGAQWGSLSDLPSNGTLEGDHYLFANGMKSLKYFGDGRVEMSVNAYNEYGGHYITFNSARKWDHFLFQQTITPPSAASPSRSLAAMSNLTFDFNIQLLYNNANKITGYDSTQHTVQFVMFFTVQNLNAASAGFGEYVWLGIPVFDEREANPPLNVMRDDGTKSLIYGIPYSKFGGEAVQNGNLVHLHADILSDAKQAVQTAISLGYLQSSDLNNYQIGGMNLGYEVTGLNVTTMQFSGLSLRAKYLVNTMAPSATQAPTPSPTPAPTATSSAGLIVRQGFFRVNGSDAIDWSNGGDAYCHVGNLDEFYLAGGAGDGSNILAVSALPAQRFDGTCVIAEPQGFFRVNGGDSVYFSNGTNAFCAYVSADAFFAAGGARDFSNVRNRNSLPSTQRNDGACQ